MRRVISTVDSQHTETVWTGAKRQRDEVMSLANARVEAEKAGRRQSEGPNPGEEHVADAQDDSEDESESRGSLAGNDGSSGSINARRAPGIGEQHEEDKSEVEDNYGEDGAGSSSIIAKRRSDAREQDEEDEDEDDER